MVFFVLANLYTYVRTPKYGDEYFFVGFPFPYYEIGSKLGTSSFSLIMVVFDIVIVFGVAYLVSWITASIFKRVDNA